jgi:formate dehydrogenase major subunit
VFSCSKASNEMNYAASKFTRAVMRTNNIDSCNRT